MEQLKNFATTTLSASITSSDTTIPLTDGSKVSATGTTTLYVDNELMTMTARSGNNATVTRAESPTVAASHSSGAAVYQVLSKRGMEQIRKDNISTNTFANAITAVRDGRLFIPNNGEYLVRDDATSLQNFYRMRPFKPALDTGFSWVNQGGATLTSAGGLLYLYAPASGGENLRIRIKSMSPPYSAICLLSTHFTSNNVPNAGIGFYETATQKISTISIARNSSLQLFTYKWSNPTTFSAVYSSTDISHGPNKPMWLKITDDNTNISFQFSYNGLDFTTLTSVARNNFFTTGPSHFMFYVNTVNASFDAAATMWHFEEGT